MGKFVRNICIAFTVIGAILLVLGLIWIYQTQNFLGRCLETKGVVIDLSWRYDSEGNPSAYPVFQFVNQRTAEEITVWSETRSYPPSYHLGQEVNILYDPENPTNAVIKSFLNIWLGPLIVTGLGGIFSTVGLIPLGFDIRKRRTIEYLKTHGIIIHGEVSKIYMVYSRSADGEHPWRISVQWTNPDSGRLHVFESDYIWYDPSDFVKIGEKMEVRIDPKNTKRYWVNIDRLPRR